jgi:hypothetical protein
MRAKTTRMRTVAVRIRFIGLRQDIWRAVRLENNLDISRYILICSFHENTTSTFQRFLRQGRRPWRETKGR